MKITHKPTQPTRIGKSVRPSEVQNGEFFYFQAYGGTSVCYLWKGMRFNLGLCSKYCPIPSSDVKEWENACKVEKHHACVIAQPNSYDLEVARAIREKY